VSDRRRDADRLADDLVGSIEAARAVDRPFFHLEFDHVFPADVYSRILAFKPESADYRPVNGRSRGLDLADGTHSRVKIELLPEFTRHLPPAKRELWDTVGLALRSDKVRRAFVRRLAPALAKRFGTGCETAGLYPIPILTRDVPGYSIPPHPDTPWKGITVQLYLPEDDANVDVGTILYGVLPNGWLRSRTQMRFAPNSGYAFVVGNDTWHSADTVHDRIRTRDSILLTYAIDQGILHRLRNRAKRLGSFLGSELGRYIRPRQGRGLR
jgi:hypothetical protein